MLSVLIELERTFTILNLRKKTDESMFLEEVEAAMKSGLKRFSDSIHSKKSK